MDLLNLFIKELVAIIYLLYMGNRKMSPVSYTTLDIVIIDFSTLMLMSIKKCTAVVAQLLLFFFCITVHILLNI